MKNSKWYISFLLVVLFSEWGFGQSTSFYVDNNAFTAGQDVVIPVKVNDFDAVIGFQFTINWDPAALDFQSVSGFGLDNLDQTNFGYGGVEQGLLTCAWSESTFSGIDLMDESSIFSLTFKVDCSAMEAGTIGFTDSPTNILLIYEDENMLPATTVPSTINGTYSFNGSNLSLNPIVTPISCAGQNDAAIEANASGGTPPYSYEWGGGGSDPTLENISDGDYFLLVTDANDCQAIAPFITVDAVDSLYICANDISYDQSCAGSGACIDVTVCNGDQGLSYEWSNGMTSSSICNLQQDVYAVTVTKANGCSAESEMIEIVNGGYNPMATQFVVTDNTCAEPGVIELSVANGQGAYNYDWSNGSNTNVINDLSGGEYFCTVSDDICEIIVGPITVNTIQPDISIAADVALPVCVEDQGSISITAMSSDEPLTYLWNTGSEESTIEALVAGEYFLTITDVNGCTIQSDTFFILEGAIVSTTEIEIDSTSCNGLADGSIFVVPTGGTMPYAFEFSNGDTNNPVTLAEGVYALTITDDLGCSTTIENLEVFAPTVLELSDQQVTDYIDATNAGNIALTVLGGTLPYNFNWSNGGTTNPLGNLEMGDYSCTITDANNCELVIENILVDQILNAVELGDYEIRFYPNPASDYLYFETKKQIDFLEFYTTDGVMVQQISGPMNHEVIDIRNFKTGGYWIKAIRKTETVFMKLMIVDK